MFSSALVLKSNNNCWFLISTVVNSWEFVCAQAATHSQNNQIFRNRTVFSLSFIFNFFCFVFLASIKTPMIFFSFYHFFNIFTYTSHLIESFFLKNAHKITMWIEMRLEYQIKQKRNTDRFYSVLGFHIVIFNTKEITRRELHETRARASS